MKIISPIMGTAVVRASSDETSPTRGISQRDLIEFVDGLYKFNVKPMLAPGGGVAALPLLHFQAGQFRSEDGNILIAQLIIASDGDAVICQDTDLADVVLTDYLAQLDAGLGYRFHEAKVARLHTSVLVVELDPAFVERAATLGVIEKLLSQALGQRDRPYRLIRLSFDSTTPSEAVVGTSVNQLLPQDFLIERRANEPLEKNRFFCRAPLATGDHIRLLEEVERVAIG